MKHKSEGSCSKGCLCDVCSGQSKGIKNEGLLKDLGQKATIALANTIGQDWVQTSVLSSPKPGAAAVAAGLGNLTVQIGADAAKQAVDAAKKVSRDAMHIARKVAPHIPAIGESRESQEHYNTLKARYEQDKKLFDETPEKDSYSRAHRSYIMNQSLARLKSHPLHPKNEMSDPLPRSSQDLENKKTQQRSKANALATSTLSVMQEDASQNKVTTDTYSFRQGAPEHVGTWTGNTFKANDPTHEVYGDKGPYQKRYKTAPGRTLSSLPHENPPNEVHVVRKPTQELNKNDEDSVNHWHDHHESMAAMYGHMAKTTGTSKEKYDWRAKQAAHQDEAMRVKPVLDPFGKIKQPHHVDDFKKYIPKPHSNEPFTHEDIKENFLTPNEEAITNVSGLLPKNHLFLNRLLTHKNPYARKLGETAKTQLSKLDFHGAARTLAQGRHHIVDENLQTDKPEKENEHFGDDISVKGTAYSLRDVGKHLNTALNHKDSSVRSMGKEAEQHIRNGNLAAASKSLTKAHKKIQSIQTTVEEKDMLRESHFKVGDKLQNNTRKTMQGVEPGVPHEVVKINQTGGPFSVVTYHLKNTETGEIHPFANAPTILDRLNEELKTVDDVTDTLPLGVEKQGPGEKYGNKAKSAPAVKPNPTTKIVPNKTGEEYSKKPQTEVKEMSEDKYTRLAEAAFGPLNRSNPFRTSNLMNEGHKVGDNVAIHMPGYAAHGHKGVITRIDPDSTATVHLNPGKGAHGVNTKMRLSGGMFGPEPIEVTGMKVHTSGTHTSVPLSALRKLTESYETLDEVEQMNEGRLTSKNIQKMAKQHYGDEVPGYVQLMAKRVQDHIKNGGKISNVRELHTVANGGTIPDARDVSGPDTRFLQSVHSALKEEVELGLKAFKQNYDPKTSSTVGGFVKNAAKAVGAAAASGLHKLGAASLNTASKLSGRGPVVKDSIEEDNINNRNHDVERDIAEIMKESYKKKRMQEEAMNIYIASSEQREDWLNVGRGSMDVLDYINKYKV